MQTKSRWEQIRGRIDDLARSYPARMTVIIFSLIVVVETALLMLPISTATGHPAHPVDALFTATSAICVTGLSVVDTAAYWSIFGKFVIAIGVATGGLGIMTLASLLALAVSRHIGLTQRIMVARETKTDALGQVGSLLKAVVITSITVEFLLFLVLLPRFLTLNEGLLTAMGHAAFLSISIFNNAGFIPMVGGIEPYVSDWWMVTPIIIGTAIGAIGFPVILDVSANWRTPSKWTLHTKLTLTTYAILSVIAAVVVAASEWNNPNTLGSQPTETKVLTAMLMGVNSRSSGISTIDIGQMTRGSWFLQDVLMFIGGGSASTGGGIKVTTLAVMALAIVAEARGDRDIEAFGRRIPPSTVRLAVAVTAIGASLVGIAILIMLNITDYSLDVVAYDVISAFGTVGLSTGITPELPHAGKIVLTVLMFTGRVGTMTVAAALALRERRRVIRLPEERPAIG